MALPSPTPPRTSTYMHPTTHTLGFLRIIMYNYVLVANFSLNVIVFFHIALGPVQDWKPGLTDTIFNSWNYNIMLLYNNYSLMRL